MYWCLDMGMEPLLAVWSGLTLDNSAVSGSDLDPYVDDILNELEVSLLENLCDHSLTAYCTVLSRLYSHYIRCSAGQKRPDRSLALEIHRSRK
jgi:hypothetical protein